MKRNYLSFSALAAFAKSPNHYLEYVTGEREETRAMVLGSATHCAILEPLHFDQRYAVSPKVDKRTKAGKETYAKFVEISNGKVVLTEEEHDAIKLMAASVLATPAAKMLLDATPHKELLLEASIEGVPFKGYADAFSPATIVDLKTAKDSSPASFERTAYTGNYHLQAAAYRILSREMGIAKAPQFAWIVVESDAPNNVVVYRQSEEAAERAEKELRQLVKRWRQWDGRSRSYVPGHAQVTLSYPKWA